MAGPEGFDPSLIETEALLKRMKPRPANLSAARIVYEAGRAVGKEEMQAQLASGSLVLASPPLASTWKKWVLPSWAAGATVLCLVIGFQLTGRNSKQPEPDYQPPYATTPNSAPPNLTPYRSPGHYSPGQQPIQDQLVERNADVAEPMDVEKMTMPVAGQIQKHTQNVSDSQNESGTPRTVPDRTPPKLREKNLAEFIRDQLPSLEPRKSFDPMEMPNSGSATGGSGMALTALGFIKSP